MPQNGRPQTNQPMSLFSILIILLVVCLIQWVRWRPLDLAHFFSLTNDPIRYGHRGANKYQPENTLASFRQAVKDGCTGIELDVHLIKDGALAVIHDKELKRTTGQTGLITQCTRDQLKSINAAANWQGRFEAIPTLDEVLEAVPENLTINIEIKDFEFLGAPDTERAVVKFIQTHQIKHRIVVSSFYPLVLRRIKKLDGTIITGLLWDFTDWREGLIPFFCLAVRPDILHPNYLAIRPWTRWIARAKGLVMQVWVVNDADRIRRLSRDPLIKGIMSDDTILLNDILSPKKGQS